MNEIQFSVSDGARHLKALDHEFNSDAVVAISALLEDLIDAAEADRDCRVVFIP